MIEGKLVTFLAEDKLALQGFLVEKKGSRKCIVYVHGMSGNFYQSILPKTIAEKAAKSGYSTFIINTRGHDGISRGSILSGVKGRRITMGTMVEKFEDSPKDIGGALAFLRKKGYRHFYLAGHSTGCQKILYYQYKRKNSDVKALIHLAPDDDYNLNRRELGRKWKALVSKAKRLVKSSHGYECTREFPFAPARFLSIADLKRTEARLFNYDGDLREFADVKTPMLVVFGTKDEGAIKPVLDYVSILRQKTKSAKYSSLIIAGARHSFKDYDSVVTKSILRWLSEIT